MRLLCVDDDAQFLSMTEEFLSRKLPRATVHTATRVAEAHDIIDAEGITCVVSDYDMPEQSGLEFLAAVRESHPDLPFILFTGKGSEEIASDAITAGVTDYLQKGSSEQFDRLAARIRHAVAEYQAERDLKERVKELTAIQAISDLLADAEADTLEHLREVVDYLPQSFQYPERAVASLSVGDTTLTSANYVAPAEALTVHDVAAAGTELSLTVGYTDTPDAAAAQGPFLEEERDLLETVLRLVTGYLDREHILADLREADRRLRIILENTTAVMYFKDTEGRYVFVNRAYEEVFDLETAEIVGRRDAEIHPPEMAAAVSENDRRVLEAGEPIEVEETITVDDTEQVYLSLKVPASTDSGEVAGVFGVSTEITERKARERQLEALNRTIPRLLAADTPAAVAEVCVEAAREILDLDANAIHLYDEAADGLVPVAHTESITELIGEPPTFRSEESIAWRVFQDGEARAVDDVRQDPEVLNPETVMRSELYLPLGEFGILVAGSPTPSTFDTKDVTVGELLASHLTSTLRQLEQEQALRSREAELRERTERLEQFASMVSHDLRNPVSLATGHLELFRDAGDEAHLDDVETALERIDELVTDLTALARSGGADIEYEELSLADVAAEAWALVETPQASLSTTPCTVMGDRSQLKTLLENLFRNAVGHGGPDVSVRVGPLEEGFYVEDTGKGIPPGERDSVFEQGYTTGYGGSGTGLTIVRRIADAHGWAVSLTEGAEGGARFEFRDANDR